MEDNYEEFIKYTESDDFMTDEEEQDFFDAYYEEEKKQYQKALSDYKTYRKNALSYMPADFYREEAENLSHIWSLGFVDVVEVEKYGKTYYNLTEESLKEIFPDDGFHRNPNLEVQEELYDVWVKKDSMTELQKEIYDKWVADGKTSEYVQEYEDAPDEFTITHSMNKLIRQYCNYEDDYSGYIALPMKDGRYWLIEFNC